MILYNHVTSTTIFLILSFTYFRKLSLFLERWICLIRTLILLAQTLHFTLLIYNSAKGMLGSTEDFRVCHGDIGGHSLHVCSITVLVDSHVCGQRNGSMLSKRPREHTIRSSPLSLCTHHFGKLIEDGSSGQRPNSIWLILWRLMNQDILCCMLTMNLIYLLCSGSQTLVGC